MRAIWTSVRNQTRSRTTVSAALLFGMMCVSGAVRGQGSAVPAAVMSQVLGPSKIGSGSALAGSNVAGSSMGVNSFGDLFYSDTYGNHIYEFPASTWTQSSIPAPTVLASISGLNPGGVAVDKNNNLYIGFAYNDYIIKVPYTPGAGGTDGTYATITAPGSSTPACTGNDTAECLESNANPSGSDTVALVFDSKGNLFITTRDTGTTANAIYECPVTSCLDAGTNAATLIYQEPTASPATSQLWLGDVAIDTAGNIFFTDSVVSSSSNNTSTSSNLKEIPYTAGSGYASTPTTIYTYTPASPGGYDSETTAVATGPNNIIYLFQLGGGVLAFPDSGGVVTNGYVVSTQTAKAGAIDAQGNLYEEFNNGSEVMVKVLLDPLTVPALASGSTSSTANFTTVLNDGSACSSSPTVTYSFSGSSAAAFSATTNSGVSCGSTAISGGAAGSGVTIASGSSLGGTLTFTPTIGGISSAVMTATDSSGNSGTANVAGSAIGTLATPTFNPPAGAYGSVQTVTISSASGGASIYYTIDGSTPSSSSTPYTAPITVGNSETLSAIAIEAGDTTSGVGTANYTINLAPTGPPDFSVAAGTYTSPQIVTITSSTPGATIYYTLDGSTPTTSSAVYSGPITVSSTETITAFAQAPASIASSVVSSAYTISLPASAFQNVVISQSTVLGGGKISGSGEQGQNPAGDTMAVTPQGNVVLSNTYGGKILEFSPAGGAPTTLGSASNAAGVATDSHGNLYIAFSYNPIVKIPYLGNGTYAAIGASQGSGLPPYPAGTPNCTGNDTAECIMASTTGGTTSVLFDAAGDMFYATSSYNGTNPNAILKVPAASLYSSTPSGTLLYQEPTGTSTQLQIGGLAVDTAGDVFFTDSAISTTTSQESYSSNLNELPLSSSGSTGYASAPTPIYQYAPTTVSQYNAELNGVAVGPNGTVYALIQNTIGILGFPSNKGAYSSSTAYLVSPVSGKLLVMDQSGNFFVEGYSNAAGGDAVTYVALNNITATAGATGSTTTATNLVTVLNDGGCSSSPTATFTASGTNASAFSAATSGSCSTVGLSSASFATTLSFTPTAAGINTATLTVTDSAGNSGSATVVGNATGTLPAPTFSPAAGNYTAIQTVSISDAADGAQIYYTTDGSTPNTTAGGSTMLYTGPISVIQTETINAIAVDAGDTTSSMASAAYTLTIPATLAPAASVPSGTYGIPQVITLSDSSPDAQIYYTTDGSPATSSSTLYTIPIPVTSGTLTINAIATSPGAANSSMATYTYTISLTPSAYQAVVMNQQTKLGTLPSGGGPQSGQGPAGDTIAINSFGDVILGNTYGGKVTLFTPQGTTTAIGSLSNVLGTAVDSHNNLYAGWYNSSGGTATIVKVPYVNGAYVPLSKPSGSTPACTGSDTVECTISTLNTNGASIMSMVFDPQGDLIYATGNSASGSGTNNTLFKIPAAALYSGSTTPTVLFTEPTASSPDTTGQLSIGALALDSAGDIFFTDSAIGHTNNQESFSSNVNELPLSSSTSTGYAAAPTVIYTYTPSSPGNYDAEIDGVAVAPNGTLYFLIQNTIGIEAIPLVSGAYSSSNIYLVSSVSGKLMSGDIYGNLVVADNGNSADIYWISVDNITVPGTQVATPASQATNVYTITNDVGCSGSPSVSFTASGTDASAFSAATTGSCSSVGTASGQFATTVTFNPSSSGGNEAILTATDSNGGKGAAEVSAVATPATQAAAPTFTPPAGTYSSSQSVTLATTTPNASIYYTVDGTTPATTVGGSTMLYSGPITVSTSETIEAIAAAQNVASSSVATATYTLPAATPTFSPGPGTYTSVQTVTIASTTPNAQIFYTLDGSTPQISAGGSTMAYSGAITVGVSETINAIATAPNFSTSAMASAVYAINLPPAATPTFSVQAGTYTSVQSVSISDATSGATIYYTVDGTTPSPTGAGTSQKYTGPIAVGASETVNAIAVASGHSPSALATAIYVINLPAPAMTISSQQTTINVPSGGSGTATITVATNATFPNVAKDGSGNVTSGGISLTCTGYLPLGMTCTLSPATLAPGPGGTATSTVTIASSSASTTIPALRGRSGVLLAGTMLAGALALIGLRKRRRFQVMLMLALSISGFSLLSGCGTTSKGSGPTSSQIVITATTVLPVTQTKVISTIPFIVTTQQ